MEIDWAGLRAAAIEAMRHAYAPYSDFPVGVAGLVDDGRVVVGCNVENASYGVGLCAECGLVSSLHATGGGRLVAISCVDANGEPLMPCGRCRQLLYEHGGPECLVEAVPAPLRVHDLLPYAFGPADLEKVNGPALHAVPESLAKWRGRGTVFVHPDLSGGATVWTGYWERSGGSPRESDASRRARTSPPPPRRSRGGRSAPRGSWWWTLPAGWPGPAKASRPKVSRRAGRRHDRLRRS
jgi:cytidine deaminase